MQLMKGLSRASWRSSLPAILAFAAIVLLVFAALKAWAGLSLGAAALGAAIVLIAAYGLVLLAGPGARRRAEALDNDFHTKLSEAERDLSMRRSKAAILASLPEPLLLIDADHSISFCNPAAERLLERQVEGCYIETALRQPELLECLEEVLAGAGQRSTEVVLTGSVERVFAAHLCPIDEDPPAKRSALLLLYDLTAAKRAERLRADFVANASHELKTPLASLSGFIETLQGPAHDDAEARERFLRIMSEQAARMARLIEDLLALSRIEMEEHSPPTDLLALDDLLRGVVREMKVQADAKSMSIELTAERVDKVCGEDDELWRVFQNLIENAIKYGRDGTTIEIRVEPVIAGTADARALGAPGALVSVRNEGEGIAGQHLPRLTERFYRVDAPHSRKLGGTGLGLAIVKHIVNRHRGVLRINSTLGKDVTVTCLFPSRKEPPASSG
jgi:two-component system phosphate regulon sensor histidine kinase PhoR